MFVQAAILKEIGIMIIFDRIIDLSVRCSIDSEN